MHVLRVSQQTIKYRTHLSVYFILCVCPRSLYSNESHSILQGIRLESFNYSCGYNSIINARTVQNTFILNKITTVDIMDGSGVLLEFNVHFRNDFL